MGLNNMKKQLLLVGALIGCALHASEADVPKKDSLRLALDSAGGCLMVHRCNRSSEEMVNAGVDAIADLRKASTQKIIDYLIVNNRSRETCDGMNPVENPLSITGVKRKDFYKEGLVKGIILYNITPDNQKSGKDLVHEIRSLRDSWSVVVNISNTKIDTDLQNYFANMNCKLLGEEPQKSYVGSILIAGGMAAALLIFLCYRFGVIKR